MAFFKTELSQFSRLALWLAITILPAHAQPERVLIVYNTLFPESLEVAEYYRQARGIPIQNLCPITTGIDTVISANIGSYGAILQTPIRNCLNAVGPKNIQYIVMSYRTPYMFSPDLNPPIYFYSVDSYLSDIWDRYSTQFFRPYPPAPHGYFADNQNQGNYYPPFVPLATYRAGSKAQLLYAVWRLDAPTVALAKGLVDKAITAELAGGPVGQGCFDMRRDAPSTGDNGYDMGEWEVYRAARAAELAGFPITEDTQVAEISCANTAFFTGWYSLYNYNTNFSWVDGAYGIHIDSASLENPRGGTNWGVGAIRDGITAVSGALQEPYLDGLPRMAGILRNLFEGATLGEAVLRNTRWLRWRVHNVGDPLYRPYTSGRGPFNNPPAEDALRLGAREVLTGKNTVAYVMLKTPAPIGGTVVNLTTTGPISVSSPVTIPQGQRIATIPVTVSTVTAITYAQLTAVAGAIAVKNDLQIYPWLGGVSVASNPVTGGQSVEGTVYLNDRAPWSGVFVTLQSNNPAAQPPASVRVTAGQTSARFTITTTAVGTGTPVTITARYAGAQQTVSFNVVP